jgi:hypothetical protein
MTTLDLVDDALDAYRGTSLDGLFLGHLQWGKFCAEKGADPTRERIDHRGVAILKATNLVTGTTYLLRA